MQSNEEKIKDFARKAGIGLVGIAGEGRFDGPPSLDPTYTLKGARAIVSPIAQGLSAIGELPFVLWVIIRGARNPSRIAGAPEPA